MKNFITKIAAFFKMIAPWVKFGIEEYRNVKAGIKLLKEKQKNDKLNK